MENEVEITNVSSGILFTDKMCDYIIEFFKNLKQSENPVYINSSIFSRNEYVDINIRVPYER